MDNGFKHKKTNDNFWGACLENIWWNGWRNNLPCLNSWTSHKMKDAIFKGNTSNIMQTSWLPSQVKWHKMISDCFGKEKAKTLSLVTVSYGEFRESMHFADKMLRISEITENFLHWNIEKCSSLFQISLNTCSLQFEQTMFRLTISVWESFVQYYGHY